MNQFSICGLCNAVFTLCVPSDPERPEIHGKENNPAGPVTSTACTHILCVQCVKQQTLPIPPNNQDVENQLQDYARCPICFMPDAFNVENPIVSAVICNLLKVVHERSLLIEQAWGQEEDCKTPSSQPKEVADLEDDPNSLTKRPDLNLMEIERLKASHFIATPDTYVCDEEQDLSDHQGFALGKTQNFKVAQGEHQTDIYTDDEDKAISTNRMKFIRDPKYDESSGDDSDGKQEEAKTQDLKVKAKPDIFISGYQRPDLSHQLQYEMIMDDDGIYDKVKEVSPTVNSSNQHHVVERPQQPPSLPGAFHGEGPHLDSTEQYNVLQELTNHSREVELVHATLVEDPEPVPELPTAIAEPWIQMSNYDRCKNAFVLFYENYKWFIWGFVLVAFFATIAALVVNMYRKTQGITQRRNRLKQIILEVSHQTSEKALGLHQMSAMNWILGTNNSWLNPLKDQDQIAQRYALATLFYSTNGLNWVNHVNFLSSYDECNWYTDKIKCSNDTVDGIYLDDHNLQGNLPSEIGHLRKLTTIHLNNNTLSGTISTQLGYLTNLTDLWLCKNKLSGTIPTGLGNLTQLQSLYLDNNKLSETIPTQLGNLSQLQFLSLEYNKLSGSIPTQLGDLTQLQSLWLSGNPLSGTIPTQLGSLTQLTRLYLDNTNFSGTIPTQLGSISTIYV